MTDREMLEFAAKAAGVDGYWIDRKRMVRDFVFIRECGLKTNLGIWNPIADDGDALRLAVKVNLLVDCSSACARPLPDSIPWQEESGDDAYKATRRAIVRAAAEIGNRMP